VEEKCNAKLCKVFQQLQNEIVQQKSTPSVNINHQFIYYTMMFVEAIYELAGGVGTVGFSVPLGTL